MTNHKLTRYYKTIETIGLLAVCVTGISLVTRPELFTFFGEPRIVLWLFAYIGICNVIFLLIRKTYRHPLIFTIYRYIWVLFFSLLVINSGGIASVVTYLFVFPILVAAVDLKVRDVVVTAVVIVIFLLSLFVQSSSVHPEFVVRHAFTTFILMLVMYLITRLVIDKEAIHANFDRLMEVERIKSDFMTIASQRLHTPLTDASYAFTTLLEHKSLPKDVFDVAQKGLIQVQHAQSVVDELLRSIQLDNHAIVLPEVVNIVDIIKHIVESHDELIKRKHVQLTLVTPDSLVTKANKSMLTLALSNIIENACMYSPDGHVEIRMSLHHREIHIDVADTGIGIPSAELSLIFERLYRGHEAEKLEPNRSGIGTYTAKRIIELHKGTIFLESKEGKGTHVHITLPIT